MARPKKTEESLVNNPLTDEVAPDPAPTVNFTESAYGLARKRVVDERTGEERVRTFLVEIKYDPITGLADKPIMTVQEDLATALHQFKIDVAYNVFKFE
jgi:hypothetical protein